MTTTPDDPATALPGRPPLVDLATWRIARDELLVREKAHTREGDALAAARRRLPMVELDGTVEVTGPDGPVPFLDLFQAPDRSGPAPARPPWRPSAGTATTTTDVPRVAGSAGKDAANWACRIPSGMVTGMATRKVTVTLDETQLDQIRTLVQAGTAPSVSGFVQHAVAVALDDVAGWGAMLAEALRRTGGALSDDERAWADDVLGTKTRPAA